MDNWFVFSPVDSEEYQKYLLQVYMVSLFPHIPAQICIY